MFVRRVKSADVTASLQRFADLHRDAASRAKHLKLVFDALCAQEKRQFMDDYSFETFHLVDELLLQANLAQTGQAVIEVESALWTLEQLLCYAPELIGSGWQKNAIEAILRKALFPYNLLVVRKIAIRLFLMWYQSLAMFDNTSMQNDFVFQCLLPNFPLKNDKSTENLLLLYCQSAEAGNGPGPSRNVPLVANTNDVVPSVKEKAQLLQVYMDKFLEYCTRETVRIEWNDEAKRLQCAKFILDRVIVLYIYEVFPDIETSGVDIYGGWESSEEHIDIRDTADPIVIARYWLIRWMTSVASNRKDPLLGNHLYHQALFSSRKGTNTLLTLLKEAIILPLPCSNVIHKVFSLINLWLLQRDLPPFIGKPGISTESFFLLLIHFLTSFFHSPYLITCGDRLSSAVALTHNLLQTIRDLCSSSSSLPFEFSVSVWCDLIRSLADGIRTVSSRSDAFGRATSGLLVQNLLFVVIYVQAIREIEIDDRVWDDILIVFQMGCWMNMIEQWSRVVDSITRALILNIFEVDVATPNNVQQNVLKNLRREKSEEIKIDDDGSFELGSEDSRSETESSVDDESIYMNSIIQRKGDGFVWLRVWMRVINLVSPLHAAHTQVAVQTISKTINTLLRVSGTDALVHWLSIRLFLLPTSAQINCIPAFCSVLSSLDPPLLLQAYAILALTNAVNFEHGATLLDYMPSMSHEHLASLAHPTLNCLAKLVSHLNYSPRSIQVAALLSPDHEAAESLLLDVISSNSAEISHQAYSLALNALALLIIERADTNLMMEVLNRLRRIHASGPLIYLFCSNLYQLTYLGQHSQLTSLLEQSLELIEDQRLVGELLWRSVAISLYSGEVNPPMVKIILHQKYPCLEGFLIRYCRQFPFPSFSLSQLNSLEHNSRSSSNSADGDQVLSKYIFIDQQTAILSIDHEDELRITSRTSIGKHCWIFTEEKKNSVTNSNINKWLQNLASRPAKPCNHISDAKELMDDPFQVPQCLKKLPQLPRALETDSTDCSDMYSFIQQNQRIPSKKSIIHPPLHMNDNQIESVPQKFLLWRSLVSNFYMIGDARQVPSNFARDLRHLDQTSSREFHKVAVIYVAKGQEEKNAILMNTSASDSFNKFIDGLGWPVQISKHFGYAGGLNGEIIAPYYSSGDTELIFHVSTRLGGDVTQKLKHLGNDEVHVVWSEHDRPYRRDTIATRFCDVLIVLYQMSPLLVRVSIETQRPLEFGPLFDGAHVHLIQLPYLVRDTVINASRAYRLTQQDCARPLQHRQKVFMDARRHLAIFSPSASISHVYSPTLKS
ncbi:unnamed protein product [Dracunculus medinensis]|uniref:Rap-GAP domain-containing protein n=1 Tax=Dracunculus medinensis TaxID=318479 RepID=A0A0N4U7A8_DRAME|nr:unnamed protein product [Dracunculus medinensis]